MQKAKGIAKHICVTVSVVAGGRMLIDPNQSEHKSTLVCAVWMKRNLSQKNPCSCGLLALVSLSFDWSWLYCPLVLILIPSPLTFPDLYFCFVVVPGFSSNPYQFENMICIRKDKISQVASSSILTSFILLQMSLGSQSI